MSGQLPPIILYEENEDPEDEIITLTIDGRDVKFNSKSDRQQTIITLMKIDSITEKINKKIYNPDPNIFDYNNSFEYSLDGGNTWILYNYPLGCYNIDYLTSILKEDINIDDIQFVGCAEEQRVDLILNNNAQVRFIPTSKFNEVIGFDNGTYTQSTRGRRYPNF